MLLNLFSEILDKRRSQARKYDLPHLLLFSLIAILAGCNRYKDIEIYLRLHREELNEYYGIDWKRGPSHSTINYFFMSLDVESMEKVFRKHAKRLAGINGGIPKKGSVAFDGKVLRGSYDNRNGVAAIQMITAYLITNDLILAHEFIEGHKTNEIPVVQEMVKDLGLQKFVVTADALHCQKKRSMKSKKVEKKQSSN